MYDYLQSEIERLKLEIEGLKAYVRGKEEQIKNEKTLILNKESEQPKITAIYEQKLETEARISLMQQKIHTLENVTFLILIAPEKDYVVSHSFPMKARIESDAKNDIKEEIEELVSNYVLTIPNGSYIAIVVRKAKYDMMKLKCSDIFNDRNSYITSKTFSVNDGIISVK